MPYPQLENKLGDIIPDYIDQDQWYADWGMYFQPYDPYWEEELSSGYEQGRKSLWGKAMQDVSDVTSNVGKAGLTSGMLSDLSNQEMKELASEAWLSDIKYLSGKHELHKSYEESVYDKYMRLLEYGSLKQDEQGDQGDFDDDDQWTVECDPPCTGTQICSQSGVCVDVQDDDCPEGTHSCQVGNEWTCCDDDGGIGEGGCNYPCYCVNGQCKHGWGGDDSVCSPQSCD